MEKTKLGISIGFYAALTFLVTFFAGYIGLVLMAGYALFAESDLWLKKTVVKVGLIAVFFSVIRAVIGFIPDILTFIENIVRIFNNSFYIPVVYNLLNSLDSIIDILEKAVFFFGALLAFKMKNLPLGPVDKALNKQFDS